MSAAAPLDGLTVLDVSSFIAAPFGGMTLAQLGAEVIRIDPIGGGPDVGRWPLARHRRGGTPSVSCRAGRQWR